MQKKPDQSEKTSEPTPTTEESDEKVEEKLPETPESTEPAKETTKAEVHQPDKAQRMAAKVAGEDAPKPNGAIEAAMSAVTMAFLAAFMLNWESGC